MELAGLGAAEVPHFAAGTPTKAPEVTLHPLIFGSFEGGGAPVYMLAPWHLGILVSGERVRCPLIGYP